MGSTILTSKCSLSGQTMISNLGCRQLGMPPQEQMSHWYSGFGVHRCAIHSCWTARTYDLGQRDAPHELLGTKFMFPPGTVENRPQQGMFRFGPFDIGRERDFFIDTASILRARSPYFKVDRKLRHRASQQ